MNFEIKTLSNGISVAELFHGKTGTAEDYTGSEIPGGYLRVIEGVYSCLVNAGTVKENEPVDFAVATSLWISACLQAKRAGCPIGRVICPFASMPWDDEALYLCRVTANEAEEFKAVLLTMENYSMFCRTAAACKALTHFREETGMNRPAVVLATQAPEIR